MRRPLPYYRGREHVRRSRARARDPKAVRGGGENLTSARLATESLELRPAAPRDFDVLLGLWNDAAVRQYLFDDREISREEAIGFFDRSQASFQDQGYGLWVFFERGRDSLGGFAGLLSSPEGDPSLIFGTRPDLWGRGYALQAASAVLHHAFDTLGLLRVVADVDEPNEASIRVLEKLGMVRTGRRIVEGRPLLDFEMQLRRSLPPP